MKSVLACLLLLLLGAWTTLVQAQDQQPQPGLPGCATSCLQAAVLQSTCSATNQTCICTNIDLQDVVALCVKTTCTIKEQLLTLNATATACNQEVRDRRETLKILTIVFGSISPFFVLMRLATRFFIMRHNGGGGSGMVLGEDDLFIVATLLVGVPSSVIIVAGMVEKGGLGLDIWTLTPATIEAFGRFFFVVEVLYFAELTLLKMSLLWFYLRIFPSRGVRIALWITIGLNVAYGLAFFLLGIFQCQPISYFWTKWDGETQGTCLNIDVIVWTNAAVSIGLDVWMLAVPLWQLRTLRMHWKKKIGVAIMFTVGTLVTVVSVLRLQSLVVFSNSTNPTQDSWDVTLWSVIEINVGIICACLPSLRLLLVRIFPVLGGSSSAASRAYGGAGAQYGTGGDKPSHNSAYGGLSKAGTVAKARAVVDAESSVKQSSWPRPHEADPRGGGGSGGITYQRSYKVSYSKQDDEESLVQMQDLEPRLRYPRGQTGSKESISTIDSRSSPKSAQRLPQR